MHEDKTPTPLTHDDPQYLKGLGTPMPLHSHSEYMAARKVADEIIRRWYVGREPSASDQAELEHLQVRISNYEKQRT